MANNVGGMNIGKRRKKLSWKDSYAAHYMRSNLKADKTADSFLFNELFFCKKVEDKVAQVEFKL